MNLQTFNISFQLRQTNQLQKQKKNSCVYCVSQKIDDVPVQKKSNLEDVECLAIHLASPYLLTLVVGLMTERCLRAEQSVTVEFCQRFLSP